MMKDKIIKKININSDVKIKLTKKGKLFIINKWDNLIKVNSNMNSSLNGELPSWMKEDEDGYSTFALWEVMQEFGEKLGNGLPLMFETEILIDGRDIK